MKWTLLVLLVVNLGLGGYQYWLSTQPAISSTEEQSTQFNNLALTSNQEQRYQASRELTPVVREKPSNRCVRITGLELEDGIPVIESRLKALEVTPTRETRRVVLYTQYQVILGPFANSDLATAELQKIEAMAIAGDKQVLKDGDFQNSIRFGVFNSESNANRKATELNNNNVEARVVGKDKLGDAVHLILNKESAALISDETLNSLLSSYANADFSRFQCN
jgi:hypothetical protein